MKRNLFILRKNSDRTTVLSNCYNFLRSLSQDRNWEVSVKYHVAARSARQNRALFGVAYPALCEFIGLDGARDVADLHEILCGEYFGWKEVAHQVLYGKSFRRPVRSTTMDADGHRSLLSTKEFSDFYFFVQRKGAELGCQVPDPVPSLMK